MTDQKIACFTSANLDYLDRALVLEASLRATNPNFDMNLVLVDSWPTDLGTVDALDRFDEVVTAEDVVGDGFHSWVFGHDVVEACTAVKARALIHFLDQGYDVVIYLDPDIAVFACLDEVLHELSTHDALLTPHQLEPDTATREIEDNEIGSLATGIFNLGFLAVRNSHEGRRLAEWWANRLDRWCFDDKERGLFTDQKWMNHAPIFFPSLGILRDPGLNVASWNLSRRRVTSDGAGTYRVNGSPLKFWHFTKATSLGPVMTERYGARDLAVAELWRWYLEALISEAEGLGESRWAYGSFDSGEPISREQRAVYRSRRDLQLTFPNPFLTGSSSNYLAWWYGENS